MAEPKYYETVDVDGTASTETLETALTSTEEEKKTIEAIAFIETTATEQHDAIVSCYIEREEIARIPLNITLIKTTSETRLSGIQWFDLNHELPVGQSFKIGHTSGTTASNVRYLIRYRIE